MRVIQGIIEFVQCKRALASPEQQRNGSQQQHKGSVQQRNRFPDHPLSAAERQGLSDWQVLRSWRAQANSSLLSGAPLLNSVSLHWFSLLGALLGITTMFGLLSYSGQQPINLLYLLLVFGPLQWLMMALSLLSLRGQGIAWVKLMLRKLPVEGLPSQVRRWALFYLSHWTGLCFAIGAALCLLVMVLVQDLAFVWATTIEVGAQGLSALLVSLSAPWSAWWPAAGVDPQLVADTQFFRMSGANQLVNASLYGRWWPFVLAFVLFYCLLPRAVLFAVGNWRCAKLIDGLPAADPQIAALLAHWRAQQVDTSSAVEDAHVALDSSASSDAIQVLTELPSPLLYWGLEPHELGALSPNDGERRPLNQACGDETMLLVPGWEPPLGALADSLASCVVEELSLVLLPLDGALSEADIQSWQLFAEGQAKLNALYLLEGKHA